MLHSQYSAAKFICYLILMGIYLFATIRILQVL